MNLGSLKVSNPYLLAPMAGYTDMPFRKICREFGCALTFSELVSVNALCFDNKKTLQYLKRDGIDKPFCIQLFGSEPELFKEAVQRVEDLCECIDINAGCPAPKVIRAKAGAYLLKDTDNFLKIIDAVVKATKKPVSIKMRMGYDAPNSDDLYRAIEDRGVSFITIHGRLKKEYFKGEVDYNHIAHVKELINIPVVANGGIDSFKKLQRVKAITGCEFFMVGQAAIGKPFIFEDFLSKRDTKRDLEFIKSVMLRHLSYLYNFSGKKAISQFRKFFHAYLKGYPNVKKFNNMINRCSDYYEAVEIIEKVGKPT
ncbi:tRNA dihydrouridine synthase [Hippea jasoniae]|uniref:tRNA dihydrouridine synthase n=1 Tax=Hippea jasoniae TaxID=944479 RepID=UPI0005578AA9|nr:tRNA-dihydrouridine synthase family protein [Hippea jasoniae]